YGLRSGTPREPSAPGLRARSEDAIPTGQAGTAGGSRTMMRHGKSWTALGVTAVATAAILTASGAAWASGPSGHARPAAASSRLTTPPRGAAAACARMMRGHPDMQRLHHQMTRGSP